MLFVKEYSSLLKGFYQMHPFKAIKANWLQFLLILTSQLQGQGYQLSRPVKIWSFFIFFQDELGI